MHNSHRSFLDLAREDLATARRRDPAARSSFEVALLYPGVHALWAHRAAHRLWRKGHRFAARALSQAARNATGIEIHPAAIIEKRFFINHKIYFTTVYSKCFCIICLKLKICKFTWRRRISWCQEAEL